ncbi:myosin-binding protein 1-like isoform X1 [Canna indica]|uniref:Myosin-binding protein 1-like isoform X1 n=1 Tax=Canna indica TaxID=4628 RepID=A0AAQ3QH40_9LILI|nr:myosin-binding protein 1-like isoform X1 [Canna indica]
MASKASVSGFRGLSTALSSAFLEWILMFLLFFDALFSYLVTKFSRLCKLQTPCMVCSRLDHIFGNERPGFYVDLICETHKAEISPLAFCSDHGELAHTMCQECLLTHATERKHSPESYKSLADKLEGNFEDPQGIPGVDGDNLHEFPEDYLASVPLLKKDVKLHAVSSLEDKSIRPDITEIDITLSSSAEHGYLHIKHGTRKKRKNASVSPKNDHLASQDIDCFSHVGYSEVKVSSDSDSEVPLQGDGERKSLTNEDGNAMDDLLSHNVESESVIVLKHNLSGGCLDGKTPEELMHSAAVSISDDKTLEKMIPISPVIDNPSETIPNTQISIDELHNISTLSSSTAAGHCIDDSKWNQIEATTVPPQLDFETQDYQEVSVRVSDTKVNVELNDAACKKGDTTTDTKEGDSSEPGQSTSNPMVSCDAYKLSTSAKGCLSSPRSNEVIEGNDSSSVQEDVKIEPGLSIREHVDLSGSFEVAVGTKESLPSPIFNEVTVGKDLSSALEDQRSESAQSISRHMDLNDAYKLAVGTRESISSPRLTEVIVRENSSRVQEDLKSESGQSSSHHMDMNDAYKLAIGTMGSLPSPRFAEVIMGKDSSRVQEDLKLLISQISAARGLESPWNEMSPSPRAYGQGDESVLQNITKTLSLERNESGLESLDGSIVSEVEGETALERLKRQIELDRKSISLLYKELEEERSASAIAANQAMAMITRLQEEKAALQMEALQYQRMMEEQAEYDQEALQKCNELLAQREKEIQDFEADLEDYRKRFADEFSIDKTVEQNGNFLDKEIAFCDKYGESEKSRWSGLGNLTDSLSCFEEEAYISKCLKKLEEKLHLFSNNGIYDNVSNLNLNDDDENGFPDNISANVHGEGLIERNIVLEGGLSTNGQYFDGDEQFHLKDGPLENNQMDENIMSEEKIPRKGPSFGEGNHDVRFDVSKQCKVENKNELVALENEVSRLRQRLETLEADRNFLEHAINSLRNDDGGVQFIKEIACDLRELRRIGITQRDHLIS